MAALRFSASYAAQLMACPGSADLEKSIPGWVAPEVDETKGAKGQGTRMHEYFELAGQLPPSQLRKVAEVLNYMADLRSTRRFQMLTEHTFEAGWLVSKPKTTVDVVLHVSDELHIVDYKWGKIPVDPEWNEQLLYYAVCAVFDGLAPKAKGVWLHILQPNAVNGLRKWYVTATELNQFKLNAQAAEAKVLAGDTTLVPNDHCTFCPANPHSRGDKGSPLCPPMMQKLYPFDVDEDAILAL